MILNEATVRFISSSRFFVANQCASFEIKQNIRIFEFNKINFMRNLLILLLIAQFQIVMGQTPTNNYKFRVYLTDKDTLKFQSVNPRTYLSEKAIDRRIEQDVDFDATDYPVSATYKKIIRELSMPIVAESKWFNTVVVHCTDSVQVNELKDLSFVDSVKYVWRGQYNSSYERMRPRVKALDCDVDTLHKSWFGVSAPQFDLHDAQYMMNAGFRGKGIDIAVIDGGFTNVDVIPSFAYSSIMGYKNFVPDGNIFTSLDHGTRVFSSMALNLPHKVIGSAPEASYLLLRSEDEASEFPVEQDYWVAAIEYADSMGVKLVNTSLGYSHFDDASLNYTHKELTGETSFITRATNIASDKGMLIVGSAGNEGSKEWRKITMPGDSKKMLTIGAISLDSTIVSFSSLGPTADGRVKPDFVSIGRNTVTIGQTGVIGTDNGTSLSSPFLVGLIGSLWSVNPQLNRNDLIDIVRRAGHQFHNPDSIYGYGIPDFKIAYQQVLKTLELECDSVSTELVNVSKTDNDFLMVTLNEPVFKPHSYSVRILDEKGSTIVVDKFESSDYLFKLSERVRNENSELYIVIQTPFKQRAFRFKI